jgi:hypothetical protein
MTERQLQQMILRWEGLARKYAERAREARDAGDEGPAWLYERCARDTKVAIEHMRARKPPPLPPMPAVDFLTASIRFETDLKLAVPQANDHATNPL